MIARNARVSNIRIHLPYLGEVAEGLQYLLEGALARAPVRVCQAVDVPLRHELAPNGRNRHDLQRNHLQIGTAVRPMHVKHISSCLFPLPCPLSPYDPLFELEKFQCRNCLQMERGEPFSTQVTTPSEMEYFAMLVCSSLSLPPRQQDVLCLGSGGKKLCSGFSVLCVTVFNGFGLCLRNFQKHHAYESSGTVTPSELECRSPRHIRVPCKTSDVPLAPRRSRQTWIQASDCLAVRRLQWC